MALTKYTGAINTIQNLSDRPNQNEGLTAAQLKLKFDQAAIDNEAYLNDVLTVEIDNLNAENMKKTGDQTIQGVKTFESSPIVPTPNTDMQASTKKYVDDVGANKSNDLNTHKTSDDHDGRYYTEEEVNAIVANLETKANITTNRKLSATGDFTGTINGLQPIETDPYLSAVVAGHTTQLADIAFNVKSFGAKGDGTSDDTIAIQNAINTGKKIFIPSGIYLIRETLIADNNTNIILDSNAILVIDTDIDGLILKRKASIQGGILKVTCNNYNHKALIVACEQGEGLFAGTFPISTVRSIVITKVGDKTGVGLYLVANGDDTSSFIVFRIFENIIIDNFHTTIKMMCGDGTALPGSNPHPYINSNIFNNIILSDPIDAIHMNTNNGEIAANQWTNLTIQGSPTIERLLYFGTSCFNNQFMNVYIWDIGDIGIRKLFHFEPWGNENYIMNNLFSNQYGNESSAIEDLSYGNIIDKIYNRNFDNLILNNQKFSGALKLNSLYSINRNMGFSNVYNIANDTNDSVISAWGDGRSGIKFNVYQNYEDTTPTESIQITKDGILAPTIDNSISCGTNDFRWTECNTKNGIVVTTPDNTKKYRISVNDSGVVTSTLV